MNETEELSLQGGVRILLASAFWTLVILLAWNLALARGLIPPPLAGRAGNIGRFLLSLIYSFLLIVQLRKRAGAFYQSVFAPFGMLLVSIGEYIVLGLLYSEAQPTFWLLPLLLALAISPILAGIKPMLQKLRAQESADWATLDQLSVLDWALLRIPDLRPARDG